MYQPPSPLRRVILVVADGLRPDAIARFNLVSIRRMMRQGSFTLSATTVTPSVTAAAMTSLLTGVAPDRHGVRSDSFFVPVSPPDVRPMPKVLAEAGMVSGAFMRELPRPFHPLAKQLTRRLGLTYTTFSGHNAREILGAFYRHAGSVERGLTIMHWPDADQAGHEHGWMSTEYGEAVTRLDDAVGTLMGMMELLYGQDTLLVFTADHGGGGAHPNRHDSLHALDRTIPIVLAGGSVTPGELRPRSSILDVPATILWALGAGIPDSYAGRPFFEPFDKTSGRRALQRTAPQQSSVVAGSTRFMEGGAE